MTLRLTRFEDANIFYDHVWAYLLQHEALHNLMLGLRDSILNGVYAAPYIVCVEDETGIVAVALRTPPHPLHFSRLTDLAALPLIAQDVQTQFATLSKVIGAADVSSAFAQIWSHMTGQTARLDMVQGLYQLTTVKSLASVLGKMSVATEEHLETLVDWTIAFAVEALSDEIQREEAEEIVRRRLPSQPKRGFRLWLQDDKVVSMAGYTGATPHGIRVNAVYTPPELRGHGYASACVAALSQELLDSGRQFCFLFTDMNNPTSNKIYQNIGYELVCDMQVYSFE